MNLNDALVILLILFGTALTACALFVIVAGPDRANSLVAVAAILAGAFSATLAFLKSQGKDDDDSGKS